MFPSHHVAADYIFIQLLGDHRVSIAFSSLFSSFSSYYLAFSLCHIEKPPSDISPVLGTDKQGDPRRSLTFSTP